MEIRLFFYFANECEFDSKQADYCLHAITKKEMDGKIPLGNLLYV